jgi:uracil-DNA glycosylase
MKKVIQQYLEQLKLSGIKEIYRNPKYKPTILTTDQKQQLLTSKHEEHKDCQNCQLWTGRIKFVYGEGYADASCMVIGEAPGDTENQTGRPFVGRAGELLDKMLAAIKINRSDVYIANIVKCRPPGNRNPEQSERLACLPYLLEQIQIIQPRIFLFLGLVAAQTLLESNSPMHVLRVHSHEFMERQAFVTYHPAYLLRSPDMKKEAWKDLQVFQKAYESLLKKA